MTDTDSLTTLKLPSMTEASSAQNSSPSALGHSETDSPIASSSKSPKKTTGQSSVKSGPTGSKAAPYLAYMGSCGRFFTRLFNPPFRYIRDLYPFMLAMDVCCFLLLVFKYNAFGEGGSGDVVRDIQSNRIPLLFVVMLILLSFLMVIDRALYLRKAVLCKLIFQLFLVIGVHVWVFYAVPMITGRPIQVNGVAKCWYFVKCVYFLLSAWQIRNGYPSSAIGNLLTRSHSLVNMVLFKVFMIVPFLFELRTLIDWTWTNTCMPVFDFFNFENMFATVFGLKCARQMEEDFPAQRGVAKGIVIKLGMGIPLVVFIIILIWLPLLMFALLNRIGSVVPLERVTFTVAIEGFPPLYSCEAQGGELVTYDESRYAELLNLFNGNRAASAFIREYGFIDVVNVTGFPESMEFWPISQPARAHLIKALRGDAEMNILVSVLFRRKSENKKKEPAMHSRDLVIPLLKESSVREDLVGVLTMDEGEVLVPKALPPYLVVPNEGQAQDAFALFHVLDTAVTRSDVTPAFESVRLSLNSVVKENITLQEVWKAQIRKGEHFQPISITVFVDKIFPSIFSRIVSGGIIAAYITVVLLVGRLMRNLITKAPMQVQIDEMPYPDRLLRVCHDVYLVREAGDFSLEEDLFAQLIFLFRSPETLIKWTRPRKPKTE